MPKFLLEVNYTLDGVKGVIAKGGTARVKAATEAVESVGGRIESFYFAFGSTDVFCVADMPDNVSMAAVALAVTGAGGAAVRTVALLTPEEVDQAAKKQVGYRPPGG
jgi:uncharacterized protein with GYD domain